MAIALHGNLRDFGMSEVFQLVGQQRKTGVLQVRGPSAEVELRFDEGRIVSAAPVSTHPDAELAAMLARCGVLPPERIAEWERSAEVPPPLAGYLTARELLDTNALREVEDLLSRETLFDLLRWEDGSFRFVSQSIRHDRAPESLLGAEQVLMDGLRMVDEWGAIAAEQLPEDAVLRRRGSLEEYRRSPAARSAARPGESERIFLLVDGHASVRRIIDLARFGTFQGMRLLLELRRSGWIEPVDTGPRAARARAASRARNGSMRRQLATWVPLLLLALMASWIWLAPPPPAPPAGAIARDPLAEARVQFGSAALRNLLEAHRLAEGSWPGSLAALARWAGAEALALTGSEAEPYYFASGERGPVVLAPER